MKVCEIAIGSIFAIGESTGHLKVKTVRSYYDVNGGYIEPDMDMEQAEGARPIWWEELREILNLDNSDLNIWLNETLLMAEQEYHRHKKTTIA